ncbi:MAG: hypothetical protein AMXMBFR22_13100 [Phycisphaerae bacterium]
MENITDGAVGSPGEGRREIIGLQLPSMFLIRRIVHASQQEFDLAHGVDAGRGICDCGVSDGDHRLPAGAADRQ